MPMKLPADRYVAPIDQTLVNLLQKIADNATDKDSDVHAVVVLRRKPGPDSDPVLFVDIHGSGCAELVIAKPDVGYTPVGPVTVNRLDYSSAMVYQGAAAPSSCWYVVGGRRYHCV